MAASKKIIERIRKLFRLQSSNNQFEATRAKEEAEALMRKYDVTKEDVAELVTEEAEAQRDAYSVFLANMGSRFFSCTFVAKKSPPAVGFRGTPRDVSRALQFYRAAKRESEGALMPPVADRLKDAAMDVWKFTWWDAFTKTIYERFGRPSVTRKEQMEPVSEERVEGQDNPYADAMEGIRRLDGELDVHWLRAEAKKSGTAAAHRIEFPLDVVTPKQKQLDSHEFSDWEERCALLEVDKEPS